MSGITEPTDKEKGSDHVAQGSTVGELLDSLSVYDRDLKVVWVDSYTEVSLGTRRVTAGIGLGVTLS